MSTTENRLRVSEKSGVSVKIIQSYWGNYLAICLLGVYLSFGLSLSLSLSLSPSLYVLFRPRLLHSKPTVVPIPRSFTQAKISGCPLPHPRTAKCQSIRLISSIKLDFEKRATSVNATFLAYVKLHRGTTVLYDGMFKVRAISI